MLMLVNRFQTDSGDHTNQGWSPVRQEQQTTSGQKIDHPPKLNGKKLQGLLKALNQRYAPSFKRKPRKKLTLKGKKKRKRISKGWSDSSTDTSEYDTDFSASTDDSSSEENWSQHMGSTPCSGVTWTQFIERLCSGQPVDPNTISPQNKDD